MQREEIKRLMEKREITKEEMDQKIQVQKAKSLGVITINNPPTNALSSAVFVGIASALNTLENDPEIEVVAIRGEGSLIFAAGADIEEILGMNSEAEAREMVEIGKTILDFLANLSKPTIALINGMCLGGGLELAAVCDYRLAADGAQFGQPEISLGIMPGLGGTQILPRMIGIKESLKLALTANRISPAKAKAIGLIDEVIPQERMIGRLKEMAAQIADQRPERKTADLRLKEIDEVLTELAETLDEMPGLAVEAIVEAVRDGVEKTLPEALEMETQIFSRLSMTEDAKEGLAAFLERRTPNFKNVKNKAQTSQTEKPRTETPADDLSEEHAAVRTLMRTFVNKELAPRVEKIEGSGEIPKDLIKKAADLGLLGIAYPEKYGGGGLGKVGGCILFEELGRVGGSFPIFVGVQTGIGIMPIYLFGTEEQKQKYLVPALKGEKIAAFALTEPEAGSDVAGLKLMAKKKGKKWILNGSKQFITNGNIADFLIVFAQTDELGGGQTQAAFIVESASAGFEVVSVEEKMAFHAIGTSTLAFDEVKVPEENMLGKVGDGFKIAMATLNYGRLTLSAGCLGGSKAAFSLAWQYAQDRQQGGQPILMYQMIQEKLAEMRADIYLLEPAIYQAAAKADAGADTRLEAAILKLKCARIFQEIVDKALQIHGGYGYIAGNTLERFYREARLHRIWEGTDEIQMLLIIAACLKFGAEL